MNTGIVFMNRARIVCKEAMKRKLTVAINRRGESMCKPRRGKVVSRELQTMTWKVWLRNS